MFTIETKRFGMEIEFQHVLPNTPYMQPGTDCFITVYNRTGGYVAHGDGHTFLHRDDQYSRPFGRKLA